MNIPCESYYKWVSITLKQLLFNKINELEECNDWKNVWNPKPGIFE
jgi:hypothetical protein